MDGNFGAFAVVSLILVGGIIAWIVKEAGATKREKLNNNYSFCSTCGAQVFGSTASYLNVKCTRCLSTPAFAQPQAAPPQPPRAMPAPMQQPLANPYAPPPTMAAGPPPAVMGAPVQGAIVGVSMPGAPFCPTCNSVAVFVTDKGAFGCQRCQRMLA